MGQSDTALTTLQTSRSMPETAAAVVVTGTEVE